MTTLNKASHEWMSRPTDQRFTSLIELDAFCKNSHANSIGKVVPNRALECQPVDSDNRAICVVGPNGAPVTPTHWAFGQLAQRAGAPASYLRELPAPLAADCINYGLRHTRDVEELGVLLTRADDGAPTTLRAVTGPNYGRIWNDTITTALVRHFGDGITGDFRVPREFGKPITVTKENTTLYASDRDMFVFLADEEHRIEMPNRRDGKNGALARGFFFWNSEVGDTTLGVTTFLFDYVCMNRIVWGAENISEIRIRHTSGAPHRWLEEVRPALVAYTNSETGGIRDAIKLAQSKRIDDVDSFLRARFSGSQTVAIKAAHMSDEQRPIETLWDAATGVTAYARGISYQKERVEIERIGGKILALAA